MFKLRAEKPSCHWWGKIALRGAFAGPIRGEEGEFVNAGSTFDVTIQNHVTGEKLTLCAEKPGMLRDQLRGLSSGMPVEVIVRNVNYEPRIVLHQEHLLWTLAQRLASFFLPSALRDRISSDA